MATYRLKYHRMNQYTFIPVPPGISTDVSPRAQQIFNHIGGKPATEAFTQDSIAEELETSLSTVQRGIKELQRKGYLWIERYGPGKVFYHLRQGNEPPALEYAAKQGNKRAQEQLQKQFGAKHG